jgi:hypothetical protein
VAWTLPSPRFAAAEPSESRLGAQGNRKNELQENSAQTPQILQCQCGDLAQWASQINGLRIVHGRLITAASRYAIKRRIALILRGIITSSFCSDREGRYERGSRPHAPSRAGRLTKQRQASSY